MADELTPPGGWLPAAAPRIAPLPRTRPWLRRVLLGIAGRFARRRTGMSVLPDVFLLLARHRRLFWPWLRFAARLMPYGTIDRRDAELVILRVGWNCRCRYEWGQHVQIGLRAGLSSEEIARVAQGPAAPGWSPRQAALLAAADELHTARVVSEATWRRLAEHFSDKQLIEVTMLVGHYEMLAGTLNSVGLSLEPETEAHLRNWRA